MGRVGCRVPARALKIQLVSRGWGRLRTHENVHRGGTLLQMHLLVLSSMHPMVQLSAIARICPPRNRARACSRPARPPPTHVSRARGGEGGAASPSVAFCHPRKKQHTATHTPLAYSTTNCCRCSYIHMYCLTNCPPRGGVFLVCLESHRSDQLGLSTSHTCCDCSAGGMLVFRNPMRNTLEAPSGGVA